MRPRTSGSVSCQRFNWGSNKMIQASRGETIRIEPDVPHSSTRLSPVANRSAPPAAAAATRRASLSLRGLATSASWMASLYIARAASISCGENPSLWASTDASSLHTNSLPNTSWLLNSCFSSSSHRPGEAIALTQMLVSRKTLMKRRERYLPLSASLFDVHAESRQHAMHQVVRQKFAAQRFPHDFATRLAAQIAYRLQVL